MHKRFSGLIPGSLLIYLPLKSLKVSVLGFQMCLSLNFGKKKYVGGCAQNSCELWLIEFNAGVYHIGGAKHCDIKFLLFSIF